MRWKRGTCLAGGFLKAAGSLAWNQQGFPEGWTEERVGVTLIVLCVPRPLLRRPGCVRRGLWLSSALVPRGTGRLAAKSSWQHGSLGLVFGNHPLRSIRGAWGFMFQGLGFACFEAGVWGRGAPKEA